MEPLEQLMAFFDLRDENGRSNREKVRERQRIIRRTADTDKTRSYEETAGSAQAAVPSGIVMEDGRVIGFGIHIFNEDVYPLQSFEIYLRGCDLTGTLDLSGCGDMVFLDVYQNRLDGIRTAGLSAMRIFGVQGNRLSSLDVSEMPACQGIDAGYNRLSSLDVSRNPELVELYLNDNRFTEIDLSRNPKLKYFYCHNNALTRLDTRANPLLRHLNATGNPMKSIQSLAPRQDGRLPLSLSALDGGCVGLRFNPVYNAQWKETGEWQQCYYAYPDEGMRFLGWYDEKGRPVSKEAEWVDAYGTSRILTARFARKG